MIKKKGKKLDTVESSSINKTEQTDQNIEAAVGTDIKQETRDKKNSENSKASHPHKVDLTPKISRHRLRKAAIIIAACIGLIMISFGAYVYAFTKSQIISKNDQENIFGQIYRILDEDAEPLQGEDQDRVNLLLLGQGGLDHPGGTLTDTIMVASLKPSTNQVALLSFPRDMVVPIYSETNPDYYEYRKLNYAVELGGIELALDKMKEITGLTMHYYVLADFSGFRDIIDSLGGLDINVDNSFTDYQYPDYNYGWQTISFTEGLQHMDGETSLQYARSRHGNNGEGSDFARAKRQQNILEALRDQALSVSTILNPSKITKLLNNFGEHVQTNAEIWEMTRFISFAQDMNRDEIINQVIDNGPGGLVYSEISDQTGAYVLIPNAGLGDYSEIEQLAQNIFGVGEVIAENAVVALQNGSNVTGLATKTANALRNAGLVINVDSVTNAQSKKIKTTTVYDLSGGTKPLARQIIEQELNLSVVSATRPKNIDSEIRLSTDLDPTIINTEVLPNDVDFVVLIGADRNQAKTDPEINTNSSTTKN